MKSFKVTFFPKSHCDSPSRACNEIIYANDENEANEKACEIAMNAHAEDWSVSPCDDYIDDDNCNDGVISSISQESVKSIWRQFQSRNTMCYL